MDKPDSPETEKPIAPANSAEGEPAEPLDADAVSDASTHEAAEPSDTPEALAQKIAKSRADNLEIPTEPITEGTSGKKSHKALWITLVIVLLVILGGGVAYYFLIYQNPAYCHHQFLPAAPCVEPEQTSSEPADTAETSETVEPTEELPKIYSRLSGEELKSEAEDSAPTFCVQIPNGVDGARDQVGLSEAKVVFEAIAEAGITRFAAIFQNPPAVIGPIRSLRIYYFNWDAPFGCAIVHAGGAQDAIQALRSSDIRELDENYTYMWRSDAYYPSGQTDYRRWNNLFTAGSKLAEYAQNNGFLSSDIHGFSHLTPPEAALDRTQRQVVRQLKIDQPSDGDTDELRAKVSRIDLRFGSIPNFNPVYTYNPTTNSYDRGYETGSPHNSFVCTSETDCSKVQLSPKVVIAMVVQEKRAAYDGYHEDISSIGAGDAYIFQNGDVILGNWEKSSRDSQIRFEDKSGNEIKLAPGQAWISAIPNYGSVHYE